MKLLLFSLFLAVCAHAIPSTYLQDEWAEWKTLHGKNYDENEEARRQLIWEENKRFVLKHNYLHDLGKKTFKVAVNRFADLTTEEFSALFLGSEMPLSPPDDFCKKANNSKILFGLPSHVDWRKEGYVTPVKNQEACGSCWAFSATGCLEGQMYKKTGNLISLSEQNLVDCSTKQGNLGCGGGLPSWAYQYINSNGGLDSEQSYPYEGIDGKCRFDESNVVAEVTGCVAVPSGSEDALKTSVATVGPISVAIDAGHQSFQLYDEGIYYEPECSQTNLDHGVLAVGYGSDDGKDYWLIKNSWGETWGGMGGYIKMARNKDNNCGISTNAVYPLV